MSEIKSVSIEDAFAITVTFLKEEQKKTKDLQAIVDDLSSCIRADRFKLRKIGFDPDNAMSNCRELIDKYPEVFKPRTNK